MVILALIIGSIGLFVTVPTNLSAAENPIELKFNYPGPKAPPSKHPLSQGVTYFLEKLEENSQGGFKTKQYAGGTLYRDDATQYAAIRDNVIQMGESSGGRLGSEIPPVYLMALPFVFDNMEHVRRFFYGPSGFNPKNGPAQKLFAPLYEEHGYKLAGYVQYGFQNFVSSKGFLAKPEDFKGVKFRIRQSKLAERIMESLGGSAQAIPYMETYTALSMGTVDAAECPLAVIQAVKWHETGDYITISRHSLLFAALLANPGWYNGLSADLKKIFDDTIAEACEFEFKTQQDIEHKMPWIMMSERPSLKFKWLTDEERGVLRSQTQSLRDEYKEKIPQAFWDAVAEARP
jgi:TRAP-type C4-dicarboxylate transport system substrate-binding protein